MGACAFCLIDPSLFTKISRTNLEEKDQKYMAILKILQKKKNQDSHDVVLHPILWKTFLV